MGKREKERETKVRERKIGRETGVGERDTGEIEREIQGEREEETGEKERER